MPLPFHQVDAFTDRPFRGNPAAVIVVDAWPDETWMQQVALEMALSETAYLVREGERAFRLRWFTPKAEVDLCGHATLASAHTLWETGIAEPGTRLTFHTRSGTLQAEKVDGWIELDFPATPAHRVEEPPGDLLEGMDVRARWVGRNEEDWLVEVATEQEVLAARPDLRRLLTLERGVILTAPATSDYDFVSRFFAPAVGIDEDPVTGSAHCTLCPFWAERLGATTMVGYQASSRGGVVKVRQAGDRVELAGQAVTVARGELLATAG